MRGFVLGLSLSVAFIAGSLFGSLGESTADAQSGRQRWEYKCERMNYHRGRDEMNGYGSQGWEMLGNPGGGEVMCFKRPL